MYDHYRCIYCNKLIKVVGACEDPSCIGHFDISKEGYKLVKSVPSIPPSTHPLITDYSDSKGIKKVILDTFKDKLAEFIYYDRKEDEELPMYAIGKALMDKQITRGHLLELLVDFLDQEIEDYVDDENNKMMDREG